MSTNLAYQSPVRRPSTVPPERPLRRVEIVPSRAQRRARPRTLYAAIAVAGVFAIIVVQLLLSIAVSNGAYSIAQLQSDNAALGRTQESLSEKADVLASPTNLDCLARDLGMLPGAASMARLDLSTGKVTGTAHPVKASGSACDTSNTSNKPLAELPQNPITQQATASGSTAKSATDSAPRTASAKPDVPSNTIPTVQTQ